MLAKDYLILVFFKCTIVDTLTQGIGKPTQLKMQAGDVVVAHPDLAHRGGPNFSPHIRYMVYFRIKHVDLEEKIPLIKFDMFADLDECCMYQTKNSGNKKKDGVNKMNSCASVGKAIQDTPVLNFTPKFLTHEQISRFLSDGVLVVPGILKDNVLEEALSDFNETLSQHGIEIEDLANTVENIARLSSTGGAGGVLDLFYPKWKLEVTLRNQHYVDAITDLYQATYGNYSAGDNCLWEHPYEKFDGSQCYAHVDRVGFRVPDSIINSSTRDKKKKSMLQRSLTPHLDCCPTSMHGGGGKLIPRWR